jgi:hypothetical protein
MTNLLLRRELNASELEVHVSSVEPRLRDAFQQT